MKNTTKPIHQETILSFLLTVHISLFIVYYYFLLVISLGLSGANLITQRVSMNRARARTITEAIKCERGVCESAICAAVALGRLNFTLIPCLNLIRTNLPPS